jgi:hypothetical protein
MRLIITIIAAMILTTLLAAADLAPPPASHDSAQSVVDTPITPPPSSRFALYVDRLEINDGHLHDTLDVMFAANGNSLAGFDLKLAASSDLIEVLDIQPGEIYDSCQWEYFYAGPVRNLGDKSDYPPVLWQAVALAEAVPDQERPECYGFDRPASLLRIIVAGATREILEDTTIPLFFFWEDCTDNTISGKSGDTIFVSASVYDYFGDELPDPKNLFPTRRGSPQQCISPEQSGRILREVDLHNGGITFRYVFDTTAAD